MKRMRKCNDEVYQLAKDQALVKKLKNKSFRPFCLCLPGVYSHLHDLIISLRGRFSPITSLTTPRFIEVPVSSQEC
jgi:hypothetical protein